MEEEIKTNNIQIETDFSEVPKIYFSKKNLRSILYNLISNGIKYRSPDKKSYIKIYTVKEVEGITLTVEDNGLGIPKEHQEKVFHMFKRFHDHVEGTGVGLYIVKRIIENEEGTIEVKSEINKGTSFSIWFPELKKSMQVSA